VSGIVNINDENVGVVSTGLDESLETVGCSFDLETHPGASVRNCPPNTGIVVCNEDLRSHLVRPGVTGPERPVVPFLAKGRDASPVHGTSVALMRR